MSHGSCTCALRKNVACSVLPAMHPSVPRPCLETCALPKLRQATTEDLQRMARALEGQAEGALDVDGRVAAKRLSSAIAQLLAQNAGAGICSRPCALPAGSCYVPGTSLAAVPAAGCALPWPRTLCRFAPGGAELNDWARTLEETARAGPPGLDRAGRAAACRLSSAVAQLVQQNRNVYEDQASSSLLSSLDEDTLAMVLAAATFREPDSLIPSGFYFNPDLHRALRLTCRRVDMSLRSQRYKDEVARAPVGRVTLREAHEQVSTCVALGATFTIRCVLSSLSSWHTKSGWRLSGCVNDSSGRINYISFGAEAAAALLAWSRGTDGLSDIAESSVVVQGPGGLRWELDEASGSWLFDGSRDRLETLGLAIVMQCRFSSYDPDIDRAVSLVGRRRVNGDVVNGGVYKAWAPQYLACDAFLLRCSVLHVVEQGSCDQGALPSWGREGRALLKDIKQLMASRGPHPSHAPTPRPTPPKPLPFPPRARDELQKTEERFFDGEGEGRSRRGSRTDDFYERVFKQRNTGGDLDAEDNIFSFWAETATHLVGIVRERDSRTGDWIYSPFEWPRGWVLGYLGV